MGGTVLAKQWPLCQTHWSHSQRQHRFTQCHRSDGGAPRSSMMTQASRALGHEPPLAVNVAREPRRPRSTEYRHQSQREQSNREDLLEPLSPTSLAVEQSRLFCRLLDASAASKAAVATATPASAPGQPKKPRHGDRGLGISARDQAIFQCFSLNPATRTLRSRYDSQMAKSPDRFRSGL